MTQQLIERIDELNRSSSDVRKGDLELRKQLAEEALALATDIQYLPGMARAHHNRGAVLRLLRNPEAAINDLRAALSLFESLGMHSEVAVAYSQLGNVYLDLAIYQPALDNLIHAQHEYMRAGDELGVAGSLMNIGNLYSRLEQHEKSIDLYKQSFELHSKLSNERGIARARGNIGLAHLLIGDTATALEHLTEALPVLEKHELYLDQCLALCTIGEIYYTDKKYDEAQTYLHRSFDLAVQHDFKRAFVSLFYHLGRVAQELGRCDEAESRLEEGLALSVELGAEAMKLKYLSTLSELHEKCGNYSRALSFQRDYSKQHATMLSIQYNTAMEVRESVLRSEQEETEKKWLESKNVELENANLELAQLNEHKDEILRIVSHDMRTPLSTIIGMGNLLRTEGVESSVDAQAYGALIEESGQRLLALVSDLLDLSKSEHGSFQLETTPTDIHELVSKTVSVFEPLALRKNVRLLFDPKRTMPEVVVDAPKMGQVIGNVLSNALKFTRPGGNVSVSIERLSSDNVRIIVKDDGIGIPEEDLARVFEKFGNHQRPGTNGERGTGLGMPIVKRFVELHNGKVTISSAVDRGTTVSIDLPV